MRVSKFNGAIVGMRFRPNVTQSDIDNIQASEIELQREPLNPHDSNAVKCMVRGKHFGYINRETAEQISPLLKQGVEYSITIVEKYAQSIQVDLYLTSKGSTAAKSGLTTKPKPTEKPGATPTSPKSSHTSHVPQVDYITAASRQKATAERQKRQAEVNSAAEKAIARGRQKAKASSSRPARQTAQSNSSNDSCFIASHLYGKDDPRTNYFRSVRDRNLITNTAGRMLITSYYLLAPHIVQLCRKSKNLDDLIRRLVNLLLPGELKSR